MKQAIHFEGAWVRKDDTALRLAWSIKEPRFGFKYVVVKCFLGHPQKLPGSRLRVRKSDVRWTVKFWGDNFDRAKSQWSTNIDIAPAPELYVDAMQQVLNAYKASKSFLTGMALQARELKRAVERGDPQRHDNQ